MSAGRPPAHGQSYARPRPNITPNRYRSPDWSSGAASGGQTRSARARRPEPVQHIGKYRVIKTIGKGNFAVVKLAKHVPTGRMVAIKIIDKSKMSQTSLHKMCREVRMMKCLEHPNIVKLFEVMETQRTLYLVLEYASGGEIFDYLITHGRMKESDVRAKFRQIISAVHYCHQKHIVHRDLKAENLLMDRNKNIKLADFGFSNEFTLGGKLNTFCGSPPYAAPELFQGKKYTGPEVDAWSLGVILFTLITGSLPFDGHNLKELKERVLKGKYSVPFYVPSDLQRLIKKFLVLNPAKRITVEAAMRDRWLNSGYHGEQLQPHVEPSSEIDNDRVELLVQLGYAREQIEQSLEMERYDEVWAAYHLLGLPLYAPPVDGHVGRPVRRTASELPTGQNIRRPDLADHAATRLAQLSNIGGGATVRLSTVGDSDDEEEEATAETKPAADSRHIAPHWAAVDSDRSFLGNESSSPVPIPLDIPMPNFDGAKSSQDSVLSDSVGATTPRKVPLVNLAGSPTSKRRQPSSRHTPRRPDHPLDSRSDDSPVWVPSSAPTRLANGHQRRGGSPSNSLDMELPSRVQSNKPAVYDGQFAHSRVAALQSQGRSPINVPRSASFNVRHVPLTNLTNRVRNVDMIQEDRSSASTESAPVTKLSYVPQRVAPPPLIRGRETTLGSSPSPPSDDWLPTNASVQPQGVRSRSPADGIAAAVASASAAPTLVGVAETAPPWHVDSSEPYRPSISHEFDSVPAGSTGFSRNVPLRRTVHTVPLSVYQSPAVNQDDISPASTPPTFRCAGSSRRNRGQPSFFGRLAAKFGRKRNPEAEKREAKVTAV